MCCKLSKEKNARATKACNSNILHRKRSFKVKWFTCDMVDRVAVELVATSVRASSTFGNRAAAFCTNGADQWKISQIARSRLQTMPPSLHITVGSNLTWCARICSQNVVSSSSFSLGMVCKMHVVTNPSKVVMFSSLPQINTPGSSMILKYCAAATYSSWFDLITQALSPRLGIHDITLNFSREFAHIHQNRRDGMQFRRTNPHNLSLVVHLPNSPFKLSPHRYKFGTTGSQQWLETFFSSNHVRPNSANSRKSEIPFQGSETSRTARVLHQWILLKEIIQTTSVRICKPTCEAGPAAEEAMIESGRAERTHGTWLRAPPRPPSLGRVPPCEQSRNWQPRRHDPLLTARTAPQPPQSLGMWGHVESGTAILSAIASQIHSLCVDAVTNVCKHRATKSSNAWSSAATQPRFSTRNASTPVALFGPTTAGFLRSSARS